jgi:hypothetical protein
LTRNPAAEVRFLDTDKADFKGLDEKHYKQLSRAVYLDENPRAIFEATACELAKPWICSSATWSSARIFSTLFFLGHLFARTNPSIQCAEQERVNCIL